MDLEEASNMTFNTTDEEFEFDFDFYEKLFIEMFTLIGVLSIITNILTIFVIFRFKKLRQEVTNVLIAHFNLLEAVYFLSTPLVLRVTAVMDFITEVELKVICVFYENEFTLAIGISLMLVLLVCDWFLKLYCERQYVKFCHIYKFFLVVIYLCMILSFVLLTQFCFQGEMYFETSFVMFVTYIVLGSCLAIINIVHLMKKKSLKENKSNVGLLMANIFFLLWCPGLVTLIVLIAAGVFNPLVLDLTFCLGYTSPIFHFIYLFYYADDFNLFFKKVFHCQCNDYKNELLEDHSVTYNDANGVQISKS